MTVEARSLLGGDWVDGPADPIPRADPATGAIVSTVRPLDTAGVERAIVAAREAAQGWASTPIHKRAAVLQAAAQIMEDRHKELAELLSQEEGKPLAESTAEALRGVRVLRYFAAEADRSTGQLFDSPREREIIRVARRPRGVVGLITPWNFPIAISIWKIAPALVFGNTVVWKPASPVPALSSLMAEMIAAAGVPPGVLNLVHCRSHVAGTLVRSGDIDALSFTGSTEVGSHIIAEASRQRTPVQAEMGGKNTAIVLQDADLDEASQAIVEGAMGSTGQRCTGTERLLVAAPVADELIERVCVGVEALTVGNGLDPGVQVGPVIDEATRATINRIIDEAQEAGAELLAAARLDPAADGCFVKPTVLEVVDTSLRVWKEEVFGPVLCVKRIDSFEDALRLANDTPYGLSASLFTNDHAVMERAVDELNVGVLHLNGPTIGADPHVPFGGRAASGYGPKEQGRAARDFYTETRTIYQRWMAPHA